MEKNYIEDLLSINKVRQLNKGTAVKRIGEFRDSFLHDIVVAVKVPGRDSHTELRRDTLKRANKDQLCSWVEALVLAFSATALPLLEDTMKDAESVEKMKEEKVSDQATIIDLQKKLIEAKDEQVKKLQETFQGEVKSVQSEMKTFASVLQKEMQSQTTEVKSFASVMSAKKVGETVRQVVEKEERGRNVIMYGVPENGDQPLETHVGEILEKTGQKPRISECCRLGQRRDGAVRPVKVILSSSSVAMEVQRSAKLLREAEGCRQIFICPDRTVEQRKAQKGLVDQLKKLRTDNPGMRYRIKGGQVMVCETSVP